jgi:hypothetical protein
MNIRIILFLFLSFIVGFGQHHAYAADATPFDEVAATLEFNQHDYSIDPEVTVYVQVRNLTTHPVNVTRPGKSDVGIQAFSSEGKSYRVVFAPWAYTTKELEPFVLNPDCDIRFGIGTIRLFEVQDGSPVKSGTVLIKAICHNSPVILPTPKDVELRGELEMNEYPLSIVVAAPPSGVVGKGLAASVMFRNDGSKDIQLTNRFAPQKDYFNVMISRLTASEPQKIEGPLPTPKIAVTPDVREAWILLRPGESIRVNVEMGEQLDAPGTYYARLGYDGPIIILADKPYYSKQQKWRSNEVAIVVKEK